MKVPIGGKKSAIRLDDLWPIWRSEVKGQKTTLKIPKWRPTFKFKFETWFCVPYDPLSKSSIIFGCTLQLAEIQEISQNDLSGPTDRVLGDHIASPSDATAVLYVVLQPNLHSRLKVTSGTFQRSSEVTEVTTFGKLWPQVPFFFFLQNAVLHAINTITPNHKKKVKIK